MKSETDPLIPNKRESQSDMHKTSAYFRTVVTLHNLRDRAKDAVESWQDRGLSDRLQDGWNNTRRAVTTKTRNFFTHSENVPCKHIPDKYSYVFRPKSRFELILLSGTVCGIEFCYSAETAFVTPILLSLGMSIKFVTMIWCLSPLVGLFLTPILGSMSDSCKSKFGRRRPFILMYSVGILLGLIFVPNGHRIGLALGDKGHLQTDINQNIIETLNGTLDSGTEMNLNRSSEFMNNPQNSQKRLSQQFDDEDVFPNLKSIGEGMKFKKNFNGTSRELSNSQKSRTDAMLDTDFTDEEFDDEFSRQVDKENLDQVLANNIGNKLDKNTESQKSLIEDELHDPKDEFSQLVDKEDALIPGENDSESKKERFVLEDQNVKNVASQNVEDENTFLNFILGRSAANSDGVLKNEESNSNVFNSENTNNLSDQTGIYENELDDEIRSDPRIDQRLKTAAQAENSESHGNIFSSQMQPWSIAFTVIGTVLLDFCSDACQSPSRTYLLDVSMPSDHAAGLSTFTVMAGLGGSIGYAMGAIHWENTFIGKIFGGQVNAVFMVVTIVFIILLIITVTSFPEIPLSVLSDPKMFKEYEEKIQAVPTGEGNEIGMVEINLKRYGSIDKSNGVKNTVEEKRYTPVGEEGRYTPVNEDTHYTHVTEDSQYCSVREEPSCSQTEARNLETGNIQQQPDYKVLYETDPDPVKPTNHEVNIYSRKLSEISVVEVLGTVHEHPSLKEYLVSIVHMPRSLRILCLTNLFCWMSLVSYSLYFTDFVGECVFEGDPKAPEGSLRYVLYQEGVQFGCWGMALYSLSCSIYSFFIESLVKKIGARTTYIGGQLVYSVGMVIMGITRHKIAVILLSPTAGVMYSTLFTMPYLLIAHYHCTNTFSNHKKGTGDKVRGIGTDVAAVSSMVFLSQFILSLSMGSITEAVGSNVVPVCAAALLSACGALSATQVTYLDI